MGPPHPPESRGERRQHGRLQPLRGVSRPPRYAKRQRSRPPALALTRRFPPNLRRLREDAAARRLLDGRAARRPRRDDAGPRLDAAASEGREGRNAPAVREEGPLGVVVLVPQQGQGPPLAAPAAGREGVVDGADAFVHGREECRARGV